MADRGIEHGSPPAIINSDSLSNALAPLHAVLQRQAEAEGDIRAVLYDLETEGREKRSQVARQLREIGLTGRAITFDSGYALGTNRATSHGDPFFVPKRIDLTGVAGTISDVWLEDDSFMMDVVRKGRFFPPRLSHTYRVDMAAATYTIGPEQTAS